DLARTWITAPRVSDVETAGLDLRARKNHHVLRPKPTRQVWAHHQRDRTVIAVRERHRRVPAHGAREAPDSRRGDDAESGHRRVHRLPLDNQPHLRRVARADARGRRAVASDWRDERYGYGRCRCRGYSEQ